MAIRLVVTFTAAPGKGSELAKAFKTRSVEVMKEPGCEQFDVFQGVGDADKVVLLERWADQAALDAHARLNSARPPLSPELRRGTASGKTTSTTGRADRMSKVISHRNSNVSAERRIEELGSRFRRGARPPRIPASR